jgi:hypothetical protein
MSYMKLFTVLPCAALCGALPISAHAQQESGMVVVRDAQTGQLRAPTAAEARALAPAPTASAAMRAAPPAMVTHPDGGRHVKLGERSLVYTIVTRGADGKLHDQCVQGAAAAEKAVHSSAPASASTSSPTAAHGEHGHD